MHRVNVVWARLPGPAGAARALLRNEVARTCAVPRREVQLIRLCGLCGSDRHGKPHVRPIGGFTPPYVNLSRAGDVVMVAFTHGGPVGVDIERSDAPSFAGFDDVVLHPQERATSVRDRATTWARLESLLKATGDGLSVDPRGIRLSGPRVPPCLIEWASRPSLPGRVWMYDVAVDAGHVAGVTLLADERAELIVREVGPEALLPPATP